MQINKKWFSIIFAVGLILVVSLLALMLLEYMIPFSRNVKGIENASQSYYEANKWVEDALLFVAERSFPWDWTGTVLSGKRNDYYIDLVASGQVLPPPGKWNSDYDPDRNIISSSEPIQLEVWYNWVASFAWTWVRVKLRVPDLDGDGSSEVLSWGTVTYVNWLLSSETDTLYASGTQLTWDDIDGSEFFLWSKDWISLGWSGASFGQFYKWSWGDYSGNPQCISSGCILKLSVVNPLETGNDKVFAPYLEWQVFTIWAWANSIPLRYSQLESIGISNGFRKTIDISIPQETLIEALDFTVFQ